MRSFAKKSYLTNRQVCSSLLSAVPPPKQGKYANRVDQRTTPITLLQWLYDDGLFQPPLGITTIVPFMEKVPVYGGLLSNKKNKITDMLSSDPHRLFFLSDVNMPGLFGLTLAAALHSESDVMDWFEKSHCILGIVAKRRNMYFIASSVQDFFIDDEDIN